MKVFKEHQWFDFKPITLLTGTNNSGKSSVINAMQMLQENLSAKTLDELLETEFVLKANQNKYGSIDTFVNKQSDENKAILEKIPAKLGYDTLIIMRNGGVPLNSIMEDLRDSLRSNRNEYKKYDNIYIRNLFLSLCKLGIFLANMNESGYFHNDIKADNIVYNENEKKARFIDLGISGQEKRKTSISKKAISDTCYFMFVMTELLDTLESKYRIKEPLVLKFKYDTEKCYDDEYVDFRGDIDNMEKYVLSGINKV
jgi:serine/threonine protein kinase